MNSLWSLSASSHYSVLTLQLPKCWPLAQKYSCLHLKGIAFLDQYSSTCWDPRKPHVSWFWFHNNVFIAVSWILRPFLFWGGHSINQSINQSTLATYSLAL